MEHIWNLGMSCVFVQRASYCKTVHFVLLCNGLLFFWYVFVQVNIWLRICLCAFEHDISVWVSLLRILCLFMVLCFHQCTFCTHTVHNCMSLHSWLFIPENRKPEQLRVVCECIRYIISFLSNCTFANVEFILNGCTGTILDSENLCGIEWMNVFFACSRCTQALVDYRNKRCFALKITCVCLTCSKCVFVKGGLWHVCPVCSLSVVVV